MSQYTKKCQFANDGFQIRKGLYLVRLVTCLLYNL